MDMPCPHCNLYFTSVDALFAHTFDAHYHGGALKELTRTNFKKTDNHWSCEIGTFRLRLEREDDHFKMTVTGIVEPLPQREPTGPEWDEALIIANQFYIAYVIAKERE